MSLTTNINIFIKMLKKKFESNKATLNLAIICEYFWRFIIIDKPQINKNYKINSKNKNTLF